MGDDFAYWLNIQTGVHPCIDLEAWTLVCTCLLLHISFLRTSPCNVLTSVTNEVVNY